MNDTIAHLAKGAGAALIGAAIGWGAQALTITGRVEAIEKGQQRVESLVLQLMQAKGIEPREPPK